MWPLPVETLTALIGQRAPDERVFVNLDAGEEPSLPRPTRPGENEDVNSFRKRSNTATE